MFRGTAVHKSCVAAVLGTITVHGELLSPEQAERGALFGMVVAAQLPHLEQHKPTGMGSQSGVVAHYVGHLFGHTEVQAEHPQRVEDKVFKLVTVHKEAPVTTEEEAVGTLTGRLQECHQTGWLWLWEGLHDSFQTVSAHQSIPENHSCCVARVSRTADAVSRA
uniref:Uncharacterized protein n=1 Tax=Ixodes ricinus TaxID=34613 RepID=A0A6B0UZ31_IXORI